MSVLAGVGYDDLVRDVRHLAARASSDLEAWLAYLVVDGKKPGTLYNYTRELALLLRTWPDLELHEFTAAHINSVLAKKPERSRYITRSIFNSFFDWAANQDETARIDRNPMVRGVPKMRVPKRRPKDIFSEEEIALLEALPLPDGPLLTLMFTTGMRKGECRNLRRDHIDLNRARLMVYHGKGDKDRIIGLPVSALKAVADLDLYEQLRRDDYLWYTKPGGGRRRAHRSPISDTTFDRWWGGDKARNMVGVLEQAGIRYLNIHQARHTYGHRLREHDIDIEERKVAMGHESIRTTEHYYGRVTAEDVATKIAGLSL